jgi:formiminotetrahydrofolate cyclodeaminase
MQELIELSIDAFLDKTADRTPTPGGGSVTGLAGAAACALARMVAAYSVKPTSPSVGKTDPAMGRLVETAATHLHRTDQLLRALVTQDATAYAHMTAAAKQAKDNPPAQAAYNDAVLAAVAVPMEMAALASNALATMDEFKSVANPRLLSDLAMAAVLADATARAARYTVRINAGGLSNTENRTKIVADIDDIVEHCACRRESIETFVRHHLEQGATASR